MPNEPLKWAEAPIFSERRQRLFQAADRAWTSCFGGEPRALASYPSSPNPTILLRISNGVFHTRREFSDFSQACASAEAYTGAGHRVTMISATGKVLLEFDPRSTRAAV